MYRLVPYLLRRVRVLLRHYLTLRPKVRSHLPLPTLASWPLHSLSNSYGLPLYLHNSLIRQLLFSFFEQMQGRLFWKSSDGVSPT